MPEPKDPTFRNYTPSQAQAYAEGRTTTYPPALYSLVMDHHTSTGGQTSQLVEVGCGPGNITRPMAAYFDHAVGLDPSAGMIDTARSLGGRTRTGEPIHFEVSTAEELDLSLGDDDDGSSVDMVTAVTAAHWFDMPRFWASAARVLKPGGSVAIWAASSIFCHPLHTPNAARVQDALASLDRGGDLDPYTLPGNRMARDLYADLPLPWQCEPPVPGFDDDEHHHQGTTSSSSSSYLRREWNRGGRLEPGEDDFFLGSRELTVARLETVLGTSSVVTRWREAHGDLAGTERDVVRVVGARIREALKDAGADPEAEFKVGVGCVLIMVKKI